MTKRTQVNMNLIILSILLIDAAGCAAPSTQLAEPVTGASVSAEWETYSNQEQCGFAISNLADIKANGESNVQFSWIFSHIASEPSGPSTNFIYISVIPDSFQGGAGEIYNYDPAATEILLNMQVGERGSTNPVPNFASGFTYTRLPDT